LISVDDIEGMLGILQRGERFASVASLPNKKSVKQVNPESVVECHFDFPPLLRYSRYITSFNRILCDYTNFEFEVISIRDGCIDVTFYATDFTLEEKNLVRRQIGLLLKETDIKEDYRISSISVFRKHRYTFNVPPLENNTKLAAT
jgi:hypothetical protein